MRKVIKDIPFVMLLIFAVSLLLREYYYPFYDKWFLLIAQFSSNSILMVIFMAFYAYLHRYCLYSWVCIIGLGLLNVLNCVAFFVAFNYYSWYAGSIIIPCLIFVVIYKLRK